MDTAVGIDPPALDSPQVVVAAVIVVAVLVGLVVVTVILAVCQFEAVVVIVVGRCQLTRSEKPGRW